LQLLINPSSASHQQKDELIQQLFDDIAKLTNEIMESKSLRSKNGCNGSKPPFYDGYAKP